jgi:hypothetical protein
VEHFVTMNHPKIDQYIVRDISYALEGGSWRWTGKRPALRLHAPPDQELNFITDFAVPEITMKETGPVSITFFLEGRPLDRVRCDAPGQRRFQKRVPPEWQLGGIITAEAEIDKVWVSPEDGRELGFVLVRAGFVR